METTTNPSGIFNVPQRRNFVKRCGKCGGNIYTEHDIGNEVYEICLQCGYTRYMDKPMPLVDIRELIE